MQPRAREHSMRLIALQQLLAAACRPPALRSGRRGRPGRRRNR